jgi:hypothetical protein
MAADAARAEWSLGMGVLLLVKPYVASAGLFFKRPTLLLTIA